VLVTHDFNERIAVHEITETKYKNNRMERETNYSLSGEYYTKTGTNTHKIQSESQAA
jgi:hypothetical protein